MGRGGNRATGVSWEPERTTSESEYESERVRERGEKNEYEGERDRDEQIEDRNERVRGQIEGRNARDFRVNQREPMQVPYKEGKLNKEKEKKNTQYTVKDA